MLNLHDPGPPVHLNFWYRLSCRSRTLEEHLEDLTSVRLRLDVKMPKVLTTQSQFANRMD